MLLYQKNSSKPNFLVYRKGQSEQVMFWIIFSILLLLATLFFIYYYFKPGTESILGKLFGGIL